MVYTLALRKRSWILAGLSQEVPASVAGVYTTNKVIAAPLLVTKASIQKSQKLQAIVVNSGVANSCTGQQGWMLPMRCSD